MTNPAHRSKWLIVGLLAIVVILTACVRPAPAPDVTPTPEGVGSPTLAPPPTTVAPDINASPTPTPEVATVVPTEVPAEPTATAVPDGGGTGGSGETVHVVAPGDTLYNISQRYGVPMADIMAANNLVNPNFLVVGQQLIIPAPGDGSGGNPPPGGGVVAVHTVRPGENLFRIGLAYNCTVDQISQFNNIPYPYTIYPGQQINVPAC